VHALAPILAGAAADGSSGTGTPAATTTAEAVVWVDGGSEVVEHLDSLATRILDGAVLASIDLESDQTGKAAVIVRFSVPGPGESAGLVAATDEVEGGHPVLAAQWGDAVQDAVWAALLHLTQARATARGEAPTGISAVAGALRLHVAAPVHITAGSAARASTPRRCKASC
jgi:hypothetical protein